MKTSKFRVTGLWAGNSPVTGEFPAQKASNDIFDDVIMQAIGHAVIIQMNAYRVPFY